MKKNTLFLIFLLLAFSYLAAQKSVALHSNGTTTIFGGDSPLIDAFNASVTGDTLYVSGGSFTAPTSINKGLVIIGAGYDVQSTVATQRTYITNSGNINLSSDSSNLYMEGMEFNPGFSISTGAITNLTFIRCKINGAFICSGADSPSNSTFLQCDFGDSVQLQGLTYSLISNCIIGGVLSYSNNNIIKNNVFLYNSTTVSPLSHCNTNTFWNNIFSSPHSTVAHSSSNNNFQYNIFVGSSQDLGSGVTDLNNYKGVDLATVYVNLSEGDYHLLQDASTNFLGDDGNEVGLYGGVLPFKEGAIPINPHITQKSIQTTTDSNGLLNISFTVEAQQN